MELFMYILRGMYITNILIICVLVVKKILMHKNKKNTEFYYENWIFGVGLFTSIFVQYYLLYVGFNSKFLARIKT